MREVLGGRSRGRGAGRLCERTEAAQYSRKRGGGSPSAQSKVSSGNSEAAQAALAASIFIICVPSALTRVVEELHLLAALLQAEVARQAAHGHEGVGQLDEREGQEDEGEAHQAEQRDGCEDGGGGEGVGGHCREVGGAGAQGRGLSVHAGLCILLNAHTSSRLGSMHRDRAAGASKRVTAAHRCRRWRSRPPWPAWAPQTAWTAGQQGGGEAHA